MTYEDAIQFIYSRRKFQKSSGHERIARLLELMDNPHKRLRFVHVVGTNGKGSVSTAIAQILQSAGYITGLFTSPFVIDFGERIKVNGEFIPKSAVASITKLLKEKIDIMEKEELYPTVFEVTTVLAMVYFCDMNCDAVVLEAGIGGGKDSTSVIQPPVLSVITSVSLDHTDVLGDSIEEITKEKCGIIKGFCPVVSYPFENGSFPFVPQNEDAARVIEEVCREKGNKLFVPDMKKAHLIKSDLTGNSFIYDGIKAETGLCGSFQAANMLTAILAARVLSEEAYMISDENIEQGIKEFFIPGRLECVSQKPAIILDAGHNEGAMKELSAYLHGQNKSGKIVALCAFMKDKDYMKALEYLALVCDEIVFTCVDPVRGEAAETLCSKAENVCKKVYYDSEPDSAYVKALGLTGENDILLVCGSFYLVSDIRKKYF